MKETIISTIDRIKPELLELSHKIHANPELGFEETLAVGWQVELLQKYGFEVEVPYCGLDTAFKAVYRGKPGGPRIAFLSEYDALKGVGHGCGHNLIATSAIGAAIGLAGVIDNCCGEVIVLGTPAEEGGGGKIIMADQGAFDSIDYAIMMHPGTTNLIGRGGLAAVSLTVEYFGKASHSAAPEKGINALTSVISLFNNIDMLRQTWKDSAKINGIISAGGVASNIIPDYAAAKFTVRAKTRKYLLKMLEDLKRVANAAGAVTGAEARVTAGLLYAERYPNLTMGETFKKHLEAMGEKMNYPDPLESIGSSDIGNVSLIVPTIHEYLAIAGPSVNSHSEEFKNAAISARADEVALKAAIGMSLTGLDIVTDQSLRDAINSEFKNTVSDKL